MTKRRDLFGVRIKPSNKKMVSRKFIDNRSENGKNKPNYSGLSTLEISKIAMCEFSYDY